MHGYKLAAFENTPLRKLEDGLVGEQECNALLHLAQASRNMGWTLFLESQKFRRWLTAVTVT